MRHDGDARPDALRDALRSQSAAADPRAAADADPDAVALAHADAGADPDAEADGDPEGDPDAEPDPDAHADAVSHPDAEADADADADTAAADPDAAAAHAEALTDAHAEAVADTVAEPHARTGRGHVMSAAASLLVSHAFVAGMLLALAAANAVIGVTMRDRLSLIFAGAVVAFAVHESIALPIPFAAHAAADAASFAFAALTIGFCGAFLDLSDRAPRMVRALRAMLAAYAAALVIELVAPRFGGGHVGDQCAFLAIAALLFTTSGAGVIALVRGSRAAKYYTIGSAGLLTGVLAAEAAARGLIPANPLTVALGGVGVAWQGVFVTAALAARVRALATRAAALEDAVHRDALTGVANRRAFDVTLAEEWRRASRTRGQIAVILCDVDMFKAFNDGYGHQAGDDVLAAVAQAMRGALHRPEDLLARYGGEEFVIVLPGCGVRDARRIAHRARMAVRALGIRHEGSPHGVVTISLGVACALPRLGGEPGDCVGAADRALYAAKRAGRDCVEVAIPVASRALA